MKLRTIGLAAGVLAAAGIASTFRLRPEQARFDGVLRLIDGEVIHYVDRGTGPPMVLLHGFGGSTFSWRYAIDVFARTHRVVALDFPGFGYSERNSSLALGHNDHAHRVARLMDELGIAGATVVGHSMGGAIAQRLALLHPDRVEQLMLVSSVNAGERRAWERASQRLRGMQIVGPAIERNPAVVRMAIGKALRQMVYDPAWVTKDVIEGYATPLARPGTARSLVRMALCAREEEPIELAAIAAPTLVVSTTADRAVPMDIGKTIASGIPGADLVVMDELGHLPYEEAPERFHAVLDAFVSGRSAAEAAALVR
jgi:pimeloyl-ACP methyl ester carboxylesterase